MSSDGVAEFPGSLPDGLLIGGEWVPSSGGARINVENPANQEVVATIASATVDDVEAALVSAESGWKSWREVDAWTRSAVLREVSRIVRAWAPSMARVLTMEEGKPLAEAKAEVLAAADQFDWYADEARRLYGRTVEGHSRTNRISVYKSAVGPVAAFVAWNFPVLLAARKLAPALAAGCSVVLKLPEEAPLTGLLLAEACRIAGVTPDAISVLTGDPVMISDRLLSSQVIRKMSLTGSVGVGQELLTKAAARITPASMELGGHAPVLVFPDADLEGAASACVRAKYRNAGQVCAAPSRFYVHKSVGEEFIEAFVSRAKELKLGDGFDPGTDVGPLINERRQNAAHRLVEDARSKGAVLALGGGRGGHDRGYFYEPSVLVDADPSMAVMSEEPFAPVAPIMRFGRLEDALAEANRTPYGLASFVYTSDLRTAVLASEGLEAGMVGVNTMLIATAEAPFGGVKMSGYGREGGPEGVDEYTVAKYVNISL